MSTYFQKAKPVIALLFVIAISLSGNMNAITGNSVVHAQSEWQNYVDPQYGFQVGYPVQGWTGAIAFQNETQADDTILQRFSLRSEEFAFINIDVWNNSAGLGTPEWIDLYQKDLLDPAVEIPATSNITIGGTDGFFLVQAPNPDQDLPGRIITILSNNGLIYWIEYIAQDGGTAQDVYISVLETFEFETGAEQPDNLPKAPFLEIPAMQAQESRESIEVFAAASFSKTQPTDGATGIATVVTLKWNAASPTPIKYRYAINTDQSTNDWTSVYDGTQVTVSNLATNQKYYWQVQAVYCDDCIPKEVVSANNGNWWSFTTSTSASTVTISGNAGIGGAILSYTDGTAKTVTAGSDGSYSITVPNGWSGTVIPSKTGYTFSPASRTYPALTANQTAQNYTALVTISGNAGIGGATLNFTGGSPVTAGPTGSYSITIPYNWSGAITPSKTGYTFFPPSRNYSAVQTNLTFQNFTALVTISGNVAIGGVGISGVKITYDGGETITNSSGDYAFKVAYLNWVGTVTPSHGCYNFDPPSQSYVNPSASQTQDYTATLKPEGCVLSITREDPDVTNATTVSFRVTFSIDVQGVDADDFALTTAGVSAPSISTVSSTADDIYIVTVNTGASNGFIRLDVKGTATITNLGGTTSIAGLPFESGEAYTIMKTTARMAPADFSGDGIAEVAVFRPSTHTWYIRGRGTFVYGQATDIPVPADYDGDGKADIAVFCPTNGTWYIRGVGPILYGQPGDIPVPADYNGDGKAELAVFRPSNGKWYIRGQGQYLHGQDGDIPVVADYNGDGKADIAVFRASNSTWYIRGIGPILYGAAGDIPVAADYNGDGRADIAVFRASNSTWYIRGIGSFLYGAAGDIPVAADYNGDGRADIAVFRASNSTWYIRGIGPILYGAAGDIPV